MIKKTLKRKNLSASTVNPLHSPTNFFGPCYCTVLVAIPIGVAILVVHPFYDTNTMEMSMIHHDASFEIIWGRIASLMWFAIANADWGYSVNATAGLGSVADWLQLLLLIAIATADCCTRIGFLLWIVLVQMAFATVSIADWIGLYQIATLALDYADCGLHWYCRWITLCCRLQVTATYW